VAKFSVQTTKEFDEDYAYWQRSNARIVAKIDQLLAAVEIDPFRGIETDL
jgi:Txe/YoeB family toxin of Txe-Axe toxin-antitoxin module